MNGLFAHWFGSRTARRVKQTSQLSLEALGDRVLPSHVLLPMAPPPDGGAPGLHVAAETNPHFGGFKSVGAFEIKDFSFSVENPSTIGSATSGAGAGIR
jgi:hypothetical protein